MGKALSGGDVHLVGHLNSLGIPSGARCVTQH